MHDPHGTLDPPSNTRCARCLREMSALQATIAAMEVERRVLRSELAGLTRKTTLMQAALRQCRKVIEDLGQTEIAKNSVDSQQPRPRFEWASLLKGSKSVSAVWGLPKKSDVPRYIARSDLETMILRTATTRVGGILGVIIEAKRKMDDRGEANWRITGIVSGKADRSVAFEAVMRAADQYAGWIAVEDGSSLNGRVITDSDQRDDDVARCTS